MDTPAPARVGDVRRPNLADKTHGDNDTDGLTNVSAVPRPKRKTNTKKKAEKQKERLASIRSGQRDVAEYPSNAEMVCDSCDRRQKNRAFCYFCHSVQRLPVCCNCGKSKCMQQTGDCLAKHAGTFATGMGLVGAVCDFCEAWVCHSRQCLAQHACKCILKEDAVCLECKRDVWSHGGRMFRCCMCAKWLCEDDQFEHQASCQTMDGESLKCGSCNRIGTWACLRCKICFCDDHVKSKTTKFTKEQGYPCKKCHFPVAAVKDHSISARRVAFGRQGQGATEGFTGGDDDEDDDYVRPATFTFGGVTIRNHGARPAATGEGVEEGEEGEKAEEGEEWEGGDSEEGSYEEGGSDGESEEEDEDEEAEEDE